MLIEDLLNYNIYPEKIKHMPDNFQTTKEKLLALFDFVHLLPLNETSLVLVVVDVIPLPSFCLVELVKL